MAFSALISIIIPVYQETQLQVSLEDLLYRQIYPDFEILVVDGDAQGNSIQSLQALDLPRVKTLISPHAGRGPQMNFGAGQALGEILLFLHADTHLPPNALAEIASTLRNQENIVGGAFDLAIDAPQIQFRLLEQISSWRSRLTRLPYGDQAHFIRRNCFEKLGGYAPWPLMEDVEWGQRLKAKHLPITILPLTAQTSARRWQKEGWLYTTLRNWTLLSLYLGGMPPEKLVQFYK